jgi:hypothetical protein
MKMRTIRLALMAAMPRAMKVCHAPSGKKATSTVVPVSASSAAKTRR